VISGETAGTNASIQGGGANLIAGNQIGTSASGESAIPSAGTGVTISSGSASTIGGTTAGARHVIWRIFAGHGLTRFDHT
jgi:hypothetical protein